MVRKFLALAFSAVLLAPLLAESTRSAEINAALRQEEHAHSEIMRTMHFLTDVYGPRLTGSPHAKAAAEWAVKTMEEWGFANGHLEPWEFGHAGWTNDHVTAHIVSPIKDQLTVEVLAWSPGTKGTVTAPVFQLAPPDRPTSSDLDAYFDRIRTQIKGKIVLAGPAVTVPTRLEARPARADEERLRSLYDPNRDPSLGRGTGRGQAAAQPPISRAELNRRIDEFLLSNGAALRVNDAGRELGQIVAFNNPTFDMTRVVPTVVMRNEDYGRIARILADGTSVTLEFNIVNSSYPEGHTAYNAVAEIPGGDKRDQVVMLGGHLDSWHSATGATDNAIGCAAVMEAARLLTAIGVKPRRTIRVALWTGEEHGLLGSQAYVRQHFGAVESPAREHLLLSAYLNLDTGTGRIRGANVFGPPAAADVLRTTLAPFVDLGVVGVASNTRRTLGDTDSTTFNAAGLPGINFDQDPIQYDAATHHTNLDTYERIVEDDVRAAAIVIAATAYELSMRDELLPRFDRHTMPTGSWR